MDYSSTMIFDDNLDHTLTKRPTKKKLGLQPSFHRRSYSVQKPGDTSKSTLGGKAETYRNGNEMEKIRKMINDVSEQSFDLMDNQSL